MIKSHYDKYKEIVNYLIVGVLTTTLAAYCACVITVLDPHDSI